MLFLFAFNVPLAEFTSVLWIIILHEFKSLSHRRRSIWDCAMLKYAVIISLIQFALHLVQIQDFESGNPPSHCNIAYPIGGWWDTGGCSFHQLIATHTPSYLTEIFWTLIRLSKGLYSTAQLSSLWASWSTGVFSRLFCFLNSGFLTEILPYRPASLSLLLTLDIVTFLTTLV